MIDTSLLYDLVIVGAGPSGMVTLRNILADGRLKNILVVDRNKSVGGLWISHAPQYSSLQVLTSDWTLHGVSVPGTDLHRRAPKECIRVWAENYAEKYNLKP